MSNYKACCVVDEFCEYPANLETDGKGATHYCFCCGQPVCKNCSSIRKYHNYGKVRLCNTCQIDYDGNDFIVLRRLYKLAGY